MQTPQPPEGNPLPPRSGPEPQPNVQVPENPPDSSTAQPAAQTFTGIVSQQGDTYVLSGAGSKSYKLDDQDRAKQFDGQKVRVLGILDQGSAIIHVQTISPSS
jgi:hypothetical protein